MRLLTILYLILNTSLVANDFQDNIIPFINKNCLECHGGQKVKGKVDFTKIKNEQDALKNFKLFESALELIHEKEMPPEDEPQPSEKEIKIFESWYYTTFVKNLKAQPAVFKPRRLSVHEYDNTIKSLFGFSMEIAVSEAFETVVEKSLVKKILPTDPPGESGFKNDTGYNPLTSEIWNGYSYITDVALERLFSPQYKNYLEQYTGVINGNLSKKNINNLLKRFMTRAYSRPANTEHINKIVQNLSYNDNNYNDIKNELKAILMSPGFIYRGVMMPKKKGQQYVDNFEYAERLSYFLWADLPDKNLYKLALSGDIRKPEVLKKEIDRMLADPKARNLSENFCNEWLTLSEIDNINLRQPILESLKNQVTEFTNYLFREDRPIIELVDSKVTFANYILKNYYKDGDQINKYNKKKGIELAYVPLNKIVLNKTPNRGGVLTMPGILAMNASKSRTSPVLRGTWILERILGDHLPEPPMDVGKVPENKKGQKLTFRQRFEMHRTQKTCAVCHDKIDPLGFALESYDSFGYDRTTPIVDKKQKRASKRNTGPIDASGSLKGDNFKDFNELKSLLTSKYKKVIIRNIVRQTMAYALHRKLEYFDNPTVEKIVDNLNNSNGTYKQLIFAIATSMPFEQTIIE